MKKYLVILLFTVWISCDTGSNSEPEETGPLNPPSWIIGIWEGGSPTKLHLEFTAKNCYNSDNKEEFAGYEETEIGDTRYTLTKTPRISIFTKINSSAIDWYVSNGSYQNITRMNKK